MTTFALSRCPSIRCLLLKRWCSSGWHCSSVPSMRSKRKCAAQYANVLHPSVLIATGRKFFVVRASSCLEFFCENNFSNARALSRTTVCDIFWNILAGVLCPPRWACLPICLRSGLSFALAGVLCPPHWAFPKQFTVGVLNAVLSVSALAGVLCPPRWACLPICLPSGFVFHLGWGAVSASLGHLALSFTLAGVLCPPGWACLPICLLPGFVFHLGWGAVSASRGLSPNSPNSLRLGFSMLS